MDVDFIVMCERYMGSRWVKTHMAGDPEVKKDNSPLWVAFEWEIKKAEFWAFVAPIVKEGMWWSRDYKNEVLKFLDNKKIEVVEFDE